MLNKVTALLLGLVIAAGAAAICATLYSPAARPAETPRAASVVSWVVVVTEHGLRPGADPDHYYIFLGSHGEFAVLLPYQVSSSRSMQDVYYSAVALHHVTVLTVYPKILPRVNCI